MKNTSRKVLRLLLLGTLVVAPSTRADTSFEFLFTPSRVTNDSQFYLNLAVRNYRYPRTAIEPMLPQIRHVETDLPVILFVARASGRPVGFIVSLRGAGLSWSTIFGRVGVPCDVLFRGIERDPGPPYGKAWGNWKKNADTLRLSDDEIVGLANVQTARRVTGMSAYDVARARGQGTSVAALVADKKGRSHHGSSSGDGGPKGSGGAAPHEVRR